MPLEEQIVEWSTSRPNWQRAVLRRVATGQVLSETDYDKLVDALLSSNEVEDADFGLEHLPQVQAGDPSVGLISIENPEHVNALTSEKPLTFEESGLTIVYGDNASGKSGYARLLKRMARARHQEEILTDVFRDTALAKPIATVKVRVGDKERSFTWPESTVPELQRMLFFDDGCAEAYISTESDFPFRPSALFVMDGLIDACVNIRSRLDTKLEENSASAKPIPTVDEDIRATEIGKYLTQLSANSSPQVLDELINASDVSPDAINHVRQEEARLRVGDVSKEMQKLTRQAVKLESLRTHLEGLQRRFGDVAISALEQQRGQVRSLEQAASLLAKSFAKEPLAGIGTSPWKELWESARRYSKGHAYPDKEFPVTSGDARCVLCQQPLDSEGRERLAQFERFVRDDTQTRLRDARERWASEVEKLRSSPTMPEVTEINLKDLDLEHSDLTQEARDLLAKYEAARKSLLSSISESKDLARFGVESSPACSRLDAAAAGARAAAEALKDTEKNKAKLATTTSKRKELELLQTCKAQRELIVGEIGRLKQRECIESAKNMAATGPITKKVLELSESNITEVVRDTFTRESDRLRLERVTIAKTRGDKGLLLHQPKLVGSRQNVILPHIFSEGEQTALGLAAFFTEAHLDSSKSALILDDPVSSLDHIRRSSVAARIAAFAETRQVIVFTHDVSFVADLKREANALGVPISERAITRGRGGERRPGTCHARHPWKAKDVSERIGELRNELARIKRDRKDWDETRYETEVATWSGNLSETWERMFSQEVVGPVLAEGGLEVRPNMVRLLARFSETDEREFQGSYSRVSQWAKRHDKSGMVNYVAPDIGALEGELKLVDEWFRRIKTYKN